jgi:glutamyl-tRNA reductase
MHRFAVTGLNHKFAPLEVRELLAFRPDILPKALRSLREDHGVAQSVILSTCNRVEIITFSDLPNAEPAVVRFLAEFHRLNEETFRPFLYHHVGTAAVEHVLRVAASLDSLVLGETQVLSQLKDSYAAASTEGATGKALNSLMHRAFAVAKDVHSQTGIGRGRLSVSSVAVDLIRRTFDDLGKKTALLIGLGETGELTLTHLREAGIGQVIVANRTHQRAEEIAKQFGGEAVPLSLLGDYLHRADIVVSQTASPSIIISRDMAEKAMKARGHRPVFMVDLAVPRDIHPEVDQIEGIYRYQVDDLERVVAEASEARSAELERSIEIVRAACAEFVRSQKQVTVEPVIAAIKEKADGLLEIELQRASGRLAALPPEAQAIVREISQRFANKLLHQPVQALKDEARAGADPALIQFAQKMFTGEEPASNQTATNPTASKPAQKTAGGELAPSESATAATVPTASRGAAP